MKRTAVVSLVSALAFASLLAAGEPKQSEPKGEKAKSVSPQPAADSPLVKAAKAAKSSRKKTAPNDKVITDASVKKSKGRLTILAEPKAPAEVTEAATAAEEQARAAARAEQQKAREEVAALRAEVARLEKELATIETNYYDEYDGELREGLWEENFGRVNAALEAAREKLAAAQKREQDLATAASAPKP